MVKKSYKISMKPGNHTLDYLRESERAGVALLGSFGTNNFGERISISSVNHLGTAYFIPETSTVIRCDADDIVTFIGKDKEAMEATELALLQRTDLILSPLY
jgi:hypothetical protein